MLKAMINAFLNLFRPVRTHNYPAEPMPLPPAYRGLIEYNEEACIFCDKCEKACPPKSIRFFQHEDGRKEYRYNAWLCIYCGECVRACPKPEEALWQSEAKARPALKADNVNGGWFDWEAECAQSRDDYAAAKKAAKAAKKNEGA
ncbi:4Fe-4S dicluster domain-containing protein [Sulfurimonas sp. HSL-1656]|uniref:4Fe-4S dicluster domain-containing protein n=1 Tax=Thiomicrolovo subterrani TaxID=3131934 RepID=UPI0031F9DC3D